jgi:ubiquinone/menaquinone biosynthesis C-methylase UbiE
MRRFLRKSTVEREPLAVTMTGVRMGERALQIGLGDVRLTTMLAAKPGLSGHAALLVSDERAGERARAAAAESGLLIDVHVAPPDALPFPDGTFDVVILHDAAASLAALNAGARTRAVSECQRVLRPGGRIVTLEAGTRSGLSALLHRGPEPDPAYDASGGTAAALQAGGFRGVRLLADREGFRYFEGLKSQPNPRA